MKDKDRTRIPGHRADCCPAEVVASWWEWRDRGMLNYCRCGHPEEEHDSVCYGHGCKCTKFIEED